MVNLGKTGENCTYTFGCGGLIFPSKYNPPKHGTPIRVLDNSGSRYFHPNQTRGELYSGVHIIQKNYSWCLLFQERIDQGVDFLQFYIFFCSLALIAVCLLIKPQTMLPRLIIWVPKITGGGVLLRQNFNHKKWISENTSTCHQEFFAQALFI